MQQKSIVKDCNDLNKSAVNKIKSQEAHDLWYHWLGHAGETTILNVGKMTTGTPNLRSKHPFF